jgi:hypothetical protein
MRVSLRSALITLCLTNEEQIKEIFSLTNTICEWKGGWGASPIPLDKYDARIYSYLQGLERTSREMNMTKEEIMEQTRSQLMEKIENPKYRNLIRNTPLAQRNKKTKEKEVEIIFIRDEKEDKDNTEETKEEGTKKEKKEKDTKEIKEDKPGKNPLAADPKNQEPKGGPKDTDDQINKSKSGPSKEQEEELKILNLIKKGNLIKSDHNQEAKGKNREQPMNDKKNTNELAGPAGIDAQPRDKAEPRNRERSRSRSKESKLERYLDKLVREQ